MIQSCSVFEAQSLCVFLNDYLSFYFFLLIQFSILMPWILSNSPMFSVTNINSFSTDVHQINKSKSLIIVPAFRNLAFSLP